VPPSPDSSTSTPPVATAGVSATPHVAAGAIDARKKTGDAQFVDEPRHPQFVDEPRPASSNPSQRARSSVSEDHAQSTVTADLSQLPPVTASGRDSLPPPSSTPSASQSSPPGASRPTSATVSNSETANRPSGSEVVTPRNQNALAATPSNTRPSQNSTANGQPTTEPVFADANAPSSAASVTPAAATAAPAPAPAQNLAGSVSFFSRFRSIRAPADSGVAAAASTGVLQLGPLLSSPVPSYPPEALRQQVQGVVELDVFLGVDGKVQSVHLVKGPAELAAAAMGAVRAWRYGQTVVGGRPMETEQSIFFTFKLSK
jgi:TonB family protein